MCGIAGAFTPGERADPEALASMVARLVHRGPDGEGRWAHEDVALGMRRLAIVDLDGGRQPLASEDGAVRVVFNGEIYNHDELRAPLLAAGHRLPSSSDGEVLPHLYEEHGPDFVARLNGIFAFALWDARRRRLMLARDQLGVKPLYLHLDARGVRFASELKALLADPSVPRRLDVRAVDELLTFRFTPAPSTLLDGVQKLEPATYLLVDERLREQRVRYWDPEPRRPRDIGFAEAADGLRERLRTAVHRQMMSDRPIGAMLSGGIDSAAVVAFMAERSSLVRTYTVGFEGGGDGDETQLARETAALFGTEHHDVVVPSLDFREALPGIVEMLEEPVGTPAANGFRAVAALARDDVPVLLSGQGADELLAGYWRYVGEWIAGRAVAIAGRAGLARPLAELARRPGPLRLQRGLRALRHPDPLARFMAIYAVLTPEQKRGLYTPALAAAAGRPERFVERLRSRRAADPPLAQMLHVDLRLWLPDDLLLVGDKMSMAESVEMRVPFLDVELVEWAEALPVAYKLRRGVRKAVEKQAMRGLLPDEIIDRKERGFLTPVSSWFRGPLHGWAAELLLDPQGTVGGTLLRRDALGALLEEHRTGRADHGRALFCLVSLELWARRFLA